MKWTSAFLVISLCTFVTSCSKQKSSLNDITAPTTIADQKTQKEKDNFRFVVTPEVTGINEINERIVLLTGHCVITEGHKIDSIALYEGANIIDANHYLATEPVTGGSATHTSLAYKQPGIYWLTAVGIDKQGRIIKTEAQSYIIE